MSAPARSPDPGRLRSAFPPIGWVGLASLALVALGSLSCAGGLGAGGRLPPCEPTRERSEPCPVKRTAPVYPEFALRVGAEALVRVEYRVLSNGRTDRVQVGARIGHPAFEAPAIEAVERWTFEPVRVAGEPRTSARQRVVIPFRHAAPPDSSRLPGILRRDLRASTVQLSDALVDGDVRGARAVLGSLRQHDWLRLDELATRRALEAVFAGWEARWDDAGRGLSDALIEDGRHLADWIGPSVDRLWDALVPAPDWADETYRAGPDAERVWREEIAALQTSANGGP